MILKQLMLWIAVCVSGLLSAQDAVTVECRVPKDMHVGEEIRLYRVEKGEMVEKAVGRYSGEGYFAFRFIPEYEGFYVVGNKNNYYYPVWVKPGEDVSVVIGKWRGTLYGKRNNEENRVLYEWIDLSARVCNMSIRSFLSRGTTAAQFFQAVDSMVVEADAFQAGIRTKNAVFNETMKRYIDFQKDYYALNYLFMPKPQGYVWPEKEDYGRYYSGIVSSRKFTDEQVLKMPEGFRLLNQYVGYAARMAGEKRQGADWEIIPSDALKGELLLKRLERYPSLFEFKKQLKIAQPYFSAVQQAGAERMLKELERKNARQETIDFTYPDVNGKMVSLSDFKGKVVLLDIWATWCGPCRAELPYLRKLEEEMAGTDLVVIGVSTDVKKDYAKWKKMVDDGEVKGIQLFANGGKSLRADYGVTGIPRFIVFDRNGKVAEAAAPRPSDPGLKELLNELLKK